MITFSDIRDNPAVHSYVTAANEALGVIGFTEHGLAHAAKVAGCAASVLKRYGGSEREVELVRIAGYMHDIGNLINREGHALSSATMAFQILSGMGMPPEEIATVCSAIGNHDEANGRAVNRVAAALILADKSDVRRSRVRVPDPEGFREDIHDRVNYAVSKSWLEVYDDRDEICLKITIDTSICPVIEYFKIFLTRMFMCKGASEFLGARFSLTINNTVLM
jgi:metal-dependent HD superfamily phosphatase/phosphodiesterase